MGLFPLPPPPTKIEIIDVSIVGCEYCGRLPHPPSTACPGCGAPITFDPTLHYIRGGE